MKIRAILERAGANRTTSSVEYELEEQQPNGDWIARMVIVSGYVTVEQDPFGTGDSPSETSFDPVSVVDKETGQKMDVKAFYASISRSAAEWIDEQAIQNASY